MMKRVNNVHTDLDPRIGGSMPALVTPTLDGTSPDLEGMRRLVEFVIGNHVSGVVVLGSTGEFSVVAPQHREAVIRTAVEAAGGRIPVLVGCGRPSIDETIAEIEQAAHCGAAAVLVTPSYYFPLSDDEIVSFFRTVATRTTLPILYYHYPQMTGARISIPVLLQLIDDGAIRGLKDSGGDIMFFARLAAACATRPDFRIFAGGSVFLLAALVLGGHGVIGPLGNFAPALECELIEAYRAGDISAAQKLQQQVIMANEGVFFASARNIAATAKYALSTLGVCSEKLFEPVAGLSQGERDAIRGNLLSLGLVSA